MNENNICKIVDTGRCVGCLACIERCALHALSKSISKEGFYQPEVNKSICTLCGQCVRVCPICRKQKKNQTLEKAYLFQNLNCKVREESTSGGFFNEVATLIMNRGGVIYGGAFDNFWRVTHIRIDDKKNISSLWGSKYVQSDMTGIYTNIKKDLEMGIFVCFSGTPCQIAALLTFLGQKYEKLLLVEVVCHGVGSPILWEQYIDNIYETYKEPIEKISFRSKKFGYAAATMEIRMKNRPFCYGKNIEAFKMLFFKGYNLRPSCFTCEFKGKHRVADLSIFDCWHMNQYDKSKDDDKGTTGILVNSAIGNEIVREIAKMHYIIEVDREKLISTDGDMIYRYPTKPKDIVKYWNDLFNGKKIIELLDVYVPYNKKKQFKVIMRMIIGKMGILKNILRR